jgi:small subunit ribosomal protein S5e
MSDIESEVELRPATSALPPSVAEQAGRTKLFQKWSFDDVEVRDISLTDYIQIVRLSRKQ